MTKIDKIAIAGAILALVAVAVSILLVAGSVFPTFSYSAPSDRYINVTGNVGPEDSAFMWTNRASDLMAQAFVIFSAAAGSLAILRMNGKRETE